MPSSAASRSWHSNRRSSRTDFRARATWRSRSTPRIGCAPPASCPRRSASLDGRPIVGLSPAEIERLVGRRRRRQGERPRSAGRRGEGPERRHDGRRDGASWHTARDPRVLDRRAGRRAPRRAADVRRVRRSARARGSSARRRERGRQVDPRHPADARAAGDAGPHGRRLSARRTIPASTSRTPGIDIEYSVDSPEEIAEIAAARDALGISATLLVANPVDAERAAPARAARRGPRPRARRSGGRGASRVTTRPRSSSTSCSARPAGGAST